MKRLVKLTFLVLLLQLFLNSCDLKDYIGPEGIADSFNLVVSAYDISCYNDVSASVMPKIEISYVNGFSAEVVVPVVEVLVAQFLMFILAVVSVLDLWHLRGSKEFYLYMLVLGTGLVNISGYTISSFMNLSGLYMLTALIVLIKKGSVDYAKIKSIIFKNVIIVSIYSYCINRRVLFNKLYEFLFNRFSNVQQQ